MANSNLPLGTKMLLYLDKFRSTQCEFVGSSKLTQPGIAAELGITRAHAAIIISRTNEKYEYIEKRLLHVPGHNRRVHCFFLTPHGKAYVRIMKQQKVGEAR